MELFTDEGAGGTRAKVGVGDGASSSRVSVFAGEQ